MAVCNLLQDVKNIHKDKRGIVVGSGYFVNYFDFNKLKEDDIIFACNQSVTFLEKADYFCIADLAVLKANFFKHGQSITNKTVMFGGAFANSKSESCLVFNRRYYDEFNFKFSNELEEVICGDVVHITSHFAYATGCNPIILVGVDLNYENGKKYCDTKSFDKIINWNRKRGWPYSHHPEGKGDPNLEQSFERWKEIKKQNPNIQFLNVNPKSRLTEIFESIEL